MNIVHFMTTITHAVLLVNHYQRFFPLQTNNHVIRLLFALEIYSKYLLIFGAYEATEMNTIRPYLEHSFASINYAVPFILNPKMWWYGCDKVAQRLMRGVLIADKQRGLRPKQLIYENNRRNKFVLIYQMTISCDWVLWSECRTTNLAQPSECKAAFHNASIQFETSFTSEYKKGWNNVFKCSNCKAIKTP